MSSLRVKLILACQEAFRGVKMSLAFNELKKVPYTDLNTTSEHAPQLELKF